MKKYVYIHICCINDWEEVFGHIQGKIKDSGLYNEITEIRCGILAQYKNVVDKKCFSDPKIKIMFVDNDNRQYERPTLRRMHEDSQKEEFYAFYCHTKGITRKHPIVKRHVRDWVNFMLYFALYKYKEVFEHLETYDCVGVNYQNVPKNHYSGNFWWTKSSHLQKLNPDIGPTYLDPEMWIASYADGKYKTLHNSNVDHYRDEYPEHKYQTNSIHNTQKNVYILDSPLIGCPLVMIFLFSEYCGVFRRMGYNVKVIKTIETIQNDDIVFMGDSFKVSNPVDLLYKQAPSAKYYGWYWFKHDVSRLPNFVHIYENFLNTQRDPRIRYYVTIPNSKPLLLRADEDPNDIGKMVRNVKMDYCYMGAPYCREYVPSAPFQGVYHVGGWEQYLNYAQRRELYLSSMFALGFQSTENIHNEHVSQRIYEGMAYGCIVLTNSKPAVIQTNGVAVWFKTKEELESLMRYYKENPEVLKKKQDEGYEFVRKYGTNSYAYEKLI